MKSDDRLNGREERRLPIMLEVNVAPAGRVDGERRERTITDNISPRGVRVVCTSEWQHGEEAEIIPTKGGTPMLGEVVYCQRVENGRFFVGLKFTRGPVPWSILHRFNGLVLTGTLCAMKW
jgi:hypothetical protein